MYGNNSFCGNVIFEWTLQYTVNEGSWEIFTTRLSSYLFSVLIAELDFHTFQHDTRSLIMDYQEENIMNLNVCQHQT